jgi:hypothetical protein
MNKLNELKELLKNKAHLAGACTDGFKDLAGTKTLDELQEVGMKHFFFACEKGLITPEMIEEVNVPYVRVNENVTDACVLVTSADEPITAYGHSFAVVLGNGKLEAYDNTEVLALDNSEVDAWDDCLVHAKGNSTVHAKDFAKVYAMENSTVEGFYESYIIRKSSTANIVNSVHYADAATE